MTHTAKQTSYGRYAFLIALGISLLIFLPFLIYDGGYFIYYGDFNVQQIPFYKLAHEAVRSGDIFWSWYTDLGANFVGSYSFYLLFSPFFWLTLPFPTEVLPFLMAPLLMLKTACAAATSCLYLERFVRNRPYAVLGSLLYAFSGWMFFNIFFNHFHEVAVFFPLLLWSVEKLVTENKKCLFAVIVAINAMVNYWFFVGEVVFVILYVLVRMLSKGWMMTPKKFIRLAVEAILGVGIASLVLIPSVLALTGNPRTGTDELLTGWSFWLYWHEQRQPAILQSLFFPPELPARPNFFPDHGAKWASLSGWLPLTGMTGVLAYFFERKNDWLKRILALCLVFALVPGLNSLFIMLNNSYYARWFYMPVLLMALASIRALEDSEASNASFRRAIFWSAIIVTVYTVMSGLTPNYVDGELVLGMAPYPNMLWAYAILSAACLVLMVLLTVYLRGNKRFLQITCGGVALISVFFGIFYMANGKNNRDRSQFVINTAIKGRYSISLPDDVFARTDVYDDLDNLAMFWHLPNIQAFHSIVPVSIMEFYPTVGVKRDVGSRPEAEYYALRPLLSVRWLFIHNSKSEQQPMPGYAKHSEQIGYNVYENDNFIPMGFGYTDYIHEEQLEDFDKKIRGNVMLRAIVLDDDGIVRNQDILTWMDTESRQIYFDEDRMAIDSANRREQAAYSFQRDKQGFTAKSNLQAETLLFFSVPWEMGWSATVNGQEAIIERANIGFMAVRVPAGEAEIRFDYETPGLGPGLLVSGGFILIWAAYLIIVQVRKPKKQEQPPSVTDLLMAGEAARLSTDEYLRLYQDKKERAQKLQHTLNEASAKNIPPALPPGEQTLAFKPPEDGNNPGEGL